MIKYEYRKCDIEGKCLLKDNINNKEYVVDLPYPFGHDFWYLDSNDPDVLKKSEEIISRI